MKLDVFLKSKKLIVFGSVLLSEIIYGIAHFTFNIGDWYIGFSLAFIIPFIVSYFMSDWLITLNNKVSIANEKIASQNKALTLQIENNHKLLSLVAHDVRAPLIGAKGTLELLEDLNIKQEELELIKKLSTQFESTINTVDQLLIWAKDQFMQTQINLERVNIEPILQKEIDLIKPLLEKKQCSINVNLKDSIYIYADAETVAVIIRNLLSNALKYSPENSIIDVSAKVQNEEAHLMVKDSGIGMSLAQIDNILNSNKAKSTFGTNNEKGFGLGLEMVKSYMALNNGQMHIESNEKEGSTFHLFFKTAPEI